MLAAAWLLGSCEPAGRDAGPDADERQAMAGWVVEALASEDPEAAMEAEQRYQAYAQRFGTDQLLPNLLRHKNPLVRKNAALAIGHLRIDCDPRPLRKAVDDAQWEVRRAALRSLVRLHPGQARFAVLLSLKDAAWQVRAEAINSIPLIGSPYSVTSLLPLLNDRDEFVRNEVVKVLEALLADPEVQLDADVTETIRKALEQSRAEMQ